MAKDDKHMDSNEWLDKLDSLISIEDHLLSKKNERIEEIRRGVRNVRTLDELYWHNRRMYDAYYVFDADSALHYAYENINLARRMGNRQWEDEWRIKLSFVLSIMGFLTDAEDELELIDVENLDQPHKAEYYIQQAYLYSHLSQFSDHRIIGSKDYDRMSAIADSIAFTHMVEGSPQYLSHLGASMYNRPEATDQIIVKLKAEVDNSPIDSRQFAINAYVLSRLYDDRGDLENRMRYLIMSGCADVATSNRDIASLEELAGILKEKGDIDRAYRYINYCIRQALNLPNRVRAASLSRVEAEIHTLWVDKLNETGSRLRLALWCLGGVLILVIVLVIALINRTRRLSRSRQEVEAANNNLNAKVEELSASRSDLEKALDELSNANQSISRINSELAEANRIKEACIAATFGLCSSYIDRLENNRKTIIRLVKSNSWNELREEVNSPAKSTQELKEFYKNFDLLFLSIYPDFVHDFNSLLQEEDRITVKDGELNMELRIYALIRLGITDSVKIASMLHCSPQTVYNYRLKTRNKASMTREGLVDAVRNLGTPTPKSNPPHQN